MSRYNIKIRRLVVLLGLLPAILAAAPTDGKLVETRWYQVELIVFAHLNRSAARAEHWPEITSIHLQGNPLDLSFPLPELPQVDIIAPLSLTAPDIGQLGIREIPNPALAPVPVTSAESLLPTPFEILDGRALQLNKAMEKLRRSKRHEPLLHVAWRQPTFQRSQAQAILLHDGVDKALPEENKRKDNSPGIYGPITAPGLSPANETAERQISLPRAPDPVSEENTLIGPANPRFVGTVKLSVSRFLHLDVDLIYRALSRQQSVFRLADYVLWGKQPYPSLQEPQGPAYVTKEWYAVRNFQLKESRRMRSTEVHYLDHPFFGVVVLVTPYELPKPKEIPAPRGVLK